jgi:hypothetical protein
VNSESKSPPIRVNQGPYMSQPEKAANGRLRGASDPNLHQEDTNEEVS